MDSEILLKKWGFKKNPFKVDTAEKEHDLHLYFVEPPYFNDIVGDIEAPTSSIVFGHRGEGKSAIFNMTRYELQKRNPKRALILPYIDFSIWSESKIRTISLDNHIERILGLAIETFIGELEKENWRLTSLSSDNQFFLQWLILRFLPASEYFQAEHKLNSLFDTVSQTNRYIYKCKWLLRRAKSYLRRKRIEIERIPDSESSAAQIIKTTVILISPQVPGCESLHKETMIDLLKKFKDLVLNAGFSSIYIMVDKVDETDVCGGRYDLAANLVAPMVTSLAFMEMDKIATKLFLPIQIEEILGERIRTDRILTRNISWSNERLNIMLNKRLRSYSDNKIESLKSFVEPAIWENFNKNILYYSALCPRNLIRLLEFIIAELCEIEQNPTIIDEAALYAGKDHFLSVRFREADSGEYQDRLRDNEEFIKD